MDGHLRAFELIHTCRKWLELKRKHFFRVPRFKIWIIVGVLFVLWCKLKPRLRSRTELAINQTQSSAQLSVLRSELHSLTTSKTRASLIRARDERGLLWSDVIWVWGGLIRDGFCLEIHFGDAALDLRSDLCRNKWPWRNHFFSLMKTDKEEWPLFKEMSNKIVWIAKQAVKNN